MSRTVELAKDTAHAAPGIAVTAGPALFGYAVADWAQWLAVVYTVLIIFNQVRRNVLPWLYSKPWTRKQWWT